MGAVALLLIALIIRLFIKNNVLIYLSLVLIVLFFWISFAKDVKKDFEIRAWHLFQEQNTYGVYEGNRTIAGTEKLNVIFMTQPFYGIPGILDDNRTIYLPKRDTLKHQIHVKELGTVSYFKDSGAGDILAFAHRGENNDSVVAYRPEYDPLDRNKIVNYHYDEESTNFHLFRFNDVADEYERAIKSYERVAFGDTRRLENEILFHEPIVLIDRENRQLRLFEKRERERFRPFSVPFTPRMAVYERNSDRIFVVYEEVRGVYILENARKDAYTALQNLVVRLIDTSVHSPEQLPRTKIHALHDQQLERLRDTLMLKPDIRYEYEIAVSGDRAYVYVTSESYPSLHLTFILAKKGEWIIRDVLYGDREKLKVLGSL